MLTLRSEQIQILAAPKLEQFYKDLVVHVRKNFPGETDAFSDETLLAHMRLVLKRARKYGIRAERDVYKYVNLTMLFGAYFDEAEETAWSNALLTDKDVADPHQRMNRLYEEAVDRLERLEEERVERERASVLVGCRSCSSSAAPEKAWPCSPRSRGRDGPRILKTLIQAGQASDASEDRLGGVSQRAQYPNGWGAGCCLSG
jgi:hypothetical protein